MKSIYVGNLNPATTPEELRAQFQTYGQVGYVNIIKDRDSGQSRGFAFIEMTNDADAERAIKALNGSILQERTLIVNYARPRRERSGDFRRQGQRR